MVKLSFQPNRITDFKSFFDKIKLRVNDFEGCKGMQLLQDCKNPSVFFTYSLWESEEDLDRYRSSETFGEVWSQIKPWFKDSPEAWTTQSYFDGFSVSHSTQRES